MSYPIFRSYRMQALDTMPAVVSHSAMSCASVQTHILYYINLIDWNALILMNKLQLLPLLALTCFILSYLSSRASV